MATLSLADKTVTRQSLDIRTAEKWQNVCIYYL